MPAGTYHLLVRVDAADNLAEQLEDNNVLAGPLELRPGDLPGADNDGVVDSEDNCPLVSNPNQSDNDAPGIVSYWRFNEWNGIIAQDSR